MHALFVNVTIEPGHAQEAQAQLETNIVPMVKEAPGVVAGYWVQSPDGVHGCSIVLFESEEAARAAEQMSGSMPRPEFVTFDLVEVREVVAQL